MILDFSRSGISRSWTIVVESKAHSCWVFGKKLL